MQDTKRRIPDTKRCIPAEGDRIRAYAELCVGQMRCYAMRPVVGKELEAHMEDQKEAYLAEGMPPEEAERLAVVQMGDPVEAGMELDRVHRPRMDWKAVTLICFLAAVGIWLQFIHAGQGGSIQTAQRFMVCTGIGIVLMLGVCFADYTILGKYPRLSWALATAVTAVGYMGTEQINGASRAGYMVMLMVPCFAGLVWFYRGQKWIGVGKVFGWLLLSWALLLVCGGLQDGLMVRVWLCGCIVMLAFAVGRGWYGIRKSKAVLILLTPAVLACFYMGRLFLRGATYQTERLKAMFGMMTGKEIPGDMNYQWLAVRQALGQLRAAGTAGVRTTGTVLPSNENYALLWVSENYGLLGAALLLALLAALTVVFCKRTGRQKNRLGALAGAGCIYVLATTAAIHVLTNFGAFIPTDCALPFISMNGGQCIALYVLMGILLSVYRGSDIRPEPSGICVSAFGKKGLKLL